jgi:hypothetical protein
VNHVHHELIGVNEIKDATCNQPFEYHENSLNQNKVIHALVCITIHVHVEDVKAW